MKKITRGFILAALFVTMPGFNMSAANQTTRQISKIDEIITHLENVGYYSDSVRFVVGMPQLAEDVIYNVELNQFPQTDDKLSDFAYLINWSMAGREEPVEGFAAYFHGNHYRYSGQRLQEYHWDWDSIPFKPKELKGLNSRSIQSTAQFADLLPAMIAAKLKDICEDSAYTVRVSADTIISGRNSVAVKATMFINGATASEQQYVFDAVSLLPVSMHFENSPGSISEQTVDVFFGTTLKPLYGEIDINEEFLIELYPEIFANFRESNFRIESLPGTRLPSFALPIINGERFTYRSGDRLPQILLLAILDPAGGFNENYIASIREAYSQMPFSTDVILAFTGTNPDRIEEQVGPQPKEQVLMSAKGLARDCGVSSFPVLIMVGKDGIVKDVILGYNNTLKTDILQKALLLTE